VGSFLLPLVEDEPPFEPFEEDRPSPEEDPPSPPLDPELPSELEVLDESEPFEDDAPPSESFLDEPPDEAFERLSVA
jgi:hypothetical protein